MIRIAALIASIFLLSNAQGAERSITLSSTTSTRDSGLFETAAQQTRSAPSPLVAPCGGGLGRGGSCCMECAINCYPHPTHKGEGSTPVRSIKPRQIHRHAL